MLTRSKFHAEDPHTGTAIKNLVVRDLCNPALLILRLKEEVGLDSTGSVSSSSGWLQRSLDTIVGYSRTYVSAKSNYQPHNKALFDRHQTLHAIDVACCQRFLTLAHS